MRLPAFLFLFFAILFLIVVFDGNVQVLNSKKAFKQSQVSQNESDSEHNPVHSIEKEVPSRFSTKDVISLDDEYQVEKLFTVNDTIPVPGNNIVACQNDEVIVIAHRDALGDFLVRYTSDGTKDIVQARVNSLIAGIVPNGPDSLLLVVQNTLSNNGEVYKITGPFATAVPNWTEF